MGLDELTAQYRTLKTSYDGLIDQTVADPSTLPAALPQIQTLNQQIAAVLDQMLTELQYAKEDPNSAAYRDQLVEQLTRIQADYNGLKTNTDTIKTLRSIRSFQESSTSSSLTIYMGIFLAIAALLVVVMVVRRQKTVSTSIPSTSPATMPTLT